VKVNNHLVHQNLVASQPAAGNQHWTKVDSQPTLLPDHNMARRSKGMQPSQTL